MPHRYLLTLGDGAVPREPYKEFPRWLRGAADLAVEQPLLCHALRTAGPFGAVPEMPADVDPKAQARLRRQARKGSRDVPWVTLVLGAECLEIQPRAFDAEGLLHAFRNDLIARVLRGDDGDHRIQERASLVVAFVRSLIEERLGTAALGTANRTPHAAYEKAPSDVPIEELGSAPLDIVGIDDWKLRLVEATAILNDLYFRAKSEQRRAVSRWSDGVLPLLGEPGRLVGEDETSASRQETVEDVKRLGIRLSRLGRVLDDVPGPAAPVDVSHLRALVERVRASVSDTDLGAPVNLGDVQALTEIAWATLVLNTEVYPPWPELLVDLCLQQGSRGIRTGSPRPAFVHATAAAAHLRNLLRPASLASEASYAAGHDDNLRNEAYREYARLLVEQATWCRRASQSTREIAGSAHREAEVSTSGPPDFTPLLASAFVTTFDVELEMALRYYYPEQPFVVAVPVHVVGQFDEPVREAEDRATSLWLGYVVRPSRRGLLDAVTKPADRDWFVLSGAPLGDDVAGGRGVLDVEALPDGYSSIEELPIIVRLSGSPLVHLPDLGSPEGWNPATDALRRRALALANGTSGELIGEPDLGQPAVADATPSSFDARQFHFVHAPLLEEHHSLRFSLPEIEVKEGVARGLPRALTLLQKDNTRRYWMLMGVQMSDSVVRLRLMAQFFSAGILHGGDYRRPLRSGAALNTSRLNPRATDLLEWAEFDLVKGELEWMTPQLRHYNDHLADTVGPTSWPTKLKECEIR